MNELVDFIRARLDEDEQVAHAATLGPWSVDSETYAETIRSVDGTNVVAGGRWGGEASVFETNEDARHIARHDPARVLREVEAKRRILTEAMDAWHQYQGELTEDGFDDYGDGRLDIVRERWDTWERALKLLALPDADHDDYRKEWGPDGS